MRKKLSPSLKDEAGGFVFDTAVGARGFFVNRHIQIIRHVFKVKFRPAEAACFQIADEFVDGKG